MNKMEDLISMSKWNDLLNKEGSRRRQEGFQGCMGFCDYRYYSCGSGCDLRALSFLCTGLFRGL